MKKSMLFTILSLILVLCLCSCSSNEKTSTIDEGSTSMIKETIWKDKDEKEHIASFMTMGTTAKMVVKEAPEITLNHIIVDEVPIYEMYSKDTCTGKMVFFFHGQFSRKEEYLSEMLNYAEAGYFCVTVDIVAHGERISNEEIMSIQATIDTAKNIDLLLEYYETNSLANPNNFALVGLSQGGSVANWYAAYGTRLPSAIIVGSTTPDFQYQEDNIAIKNGERTNAIWTDDVIQKFIDDNNPINNVERFIDIPIMSGNGLDDEVISYKGAESLEKLIVNKGNASSKFYYFEHAGHEVTEEFMRNVIPFLDNNM